MNDRSICILIAASGKMDMLLLKMFTGHILPAAAILEAEQIAALPALLRQTIPDLILLDLHMPGAPAGVTELLEDMGLDFVPVIGLGVDALPELPGGILDMLYQPVEEEALARVIAQWLPPQGHSNMADESFVPRLDKNAIVLHVGTDKSIHHDVWQIVIRQLKEDLQQLEQEMLPSGPEALRSWAHRLYGGARTVGLLRLASLARRLEQQEAGSGSPLLLVEAIKAEIAAVLPLIQEQLDEPAS